MKCPNGGRSNRREAKATVNGAAFDMTSTVEVGVHSRFFPVSDCRL